MERFKRLPNGDVVVTGELLGQNADGEGTVLVPAEFWNEQLEWWANEKADQLLKMMVEHQRVSINEEGK